MFNYKNVLKGIVLANIIAFSPIAMAGSMTLDENLSALHFVSIKKGTTAEVHSIQKLAGSISDKGELNIQLFLTSVETNIPIRNDRINHHVFESEKNPIATITANVEGKIPEVGVAKVEAEGKLHLRGITKKINVSIIVASTADKVTVSSIQPVIIKASDYGMEVGVKKLQELAKLSSIATAVPVNFTLTFTK